MQLEDFARARTARHIDFQTKGSSRHCTVHVEFHPMRAGDRRPGPVQQTSLRTWTLKGPQRGWSQKVGHRGCRTLHEGELTVLRRGGAESRHRAVRTV